MMAQRKSVRSLFAVFALFTCTIFLFHSDRDADQFALNRINSLFPSILDTVDDLLPGAADHSNTELEMRYVDHRYFSHDQLRSLVKLVETSYGEKLDIYAINRDLGEFRSVVALALFGDNVEPAQGFASYQAYLESEFEYMQILTTNEKLDASLKLSEAQTLLLTELMLNERLRGEAIADVSYSSAAERYYASTSPSENTSPSLAATQLTMVDQ